MNRTEHWIKGSDNAITLYLLEDDDPILGVWNELRIAIGDPVLVAITRLGDGDGISFAGGTLSIQPGALTAQEILDTNAALRDDRVERVSIRIKSSTDINGVHFGEDDSDDRLYFHIHNPP